MLIHAKQNSWKKNRGELQGEGDQPFIPEIRRDGARGPIEQRIGADNYGVFTAL
jgi:hypothetical protein